MSQLLKYHFFSYQASGRRPIQEDAVMIRPERGVFAIADGFGGIHKEEEQIALYACQSVMDFIENKMGDLEATLPFEMRKYYTLGGNIIFNSLLYANQNILQYNSTKSVNEMGGASVCAGFISYNRLSIGNIGLCQGYLVRNGVKRQIVFPRSYSSFLALEEFETDFQDFPMMALGVFEDMQPEVTEYQLKEDDVLIFSTDGFQGMLQEWMGNFKLNKFNSDELFQSADEHLKLIEGKTSDNSSLLLIKVSQKNS